MTTRIPAGVLRGPWDERTFLQFVDGTRAPMRLAANCPSGFPMVTPLWHVWAEGAVWAAARPGSALVRNLKRDGRCAFEISVQTPPYKGVRGHGHAVVESNGRAVLEDVLARFMGDRAPEFQARLLRDADDECAIRIRPDRLTAWDFSRRMAA